MSPGPLLLLAAAATLSAIVAGPRSARAWLALILTGTVAGLAAALMVLGGSVDWEWHSDFALGGEDVHLRLDGVSALFLVLLCVVGGAATVYAQEYWSEKQYPQSAPRGRAWWGGLLLSMTWVLLCANGLHFLIGWELFTVCAFFLIRRDDRRPAVRAASWLYLVASHAGTVFLFAFFNALAVRRGSWDLDAMRDQAELAPLFWLALAGFGIKAGMFPLHFWLPAAHANAPSHVSAILSGVAIKMGIYSLVRFSGLLPVPAAAGWVVIGLGAVSALLGIAFALVQNDYKRLLAYCSVENIGIILIGLGGALLAVSQNDAPWGRLALAGAFLHVWNHGVSKALLFLGAGSVLHATGTREMSRLGGLWQRMPWTTGLFAVGAIAVAALPPLNGFISEWLVYLGLFEAASTRTIAAWAAIPAIILLAVSGALALASFTKAIGIIFLGAPRTAAASRAHECGRMMRGPMLVLGGLCAALGLLPLLFWPAIARAVGSWRPGWADAPAPVALGQLSAAQVLLGVAGVAAAVWLWRKARGGSARRGLTWDCGYATPAARMQYTGGSMAGVAAGWFDWALQPELRQQRPRGQFPASAFRRERIPETVLEKILGPVSAAIRQLAAVARRLQHGRLQFYLLYVVIGLAALGLLVWLEGRP